MGYRSCSHSTHHHYTQETCKPMMQPHSLTILLLMSTMCLVSSLFLLDPKTGRPVSVEGRPRRPLWSWRQPQVLQTVSQNSVETPDTDQPPRPRSDYISETGTPLYKLRQRNPYGG